MHSFRVATKNLSERVLHRRKSKRQQKNAAREKAEETRRELERTLDHERSAHQEAEFRARLTEEARKQLELTLDEKKKETEARTQQEEKRIDENSRQNNQFQQSLNHTLTLHRKAEERTERAEETCRILEQACQEIGDRAQKDKKQHEEHSQILKKTCQEAEERAKLAEEKYKDAEERADKFQQRLDEISRKHEQIESTLAQERTEAVDRDQQAQQLIDKKRCRIAQLEIALSEERNAREATQNRADQSEAALIEAQNACQAADERERQEKRRFDEQRDKMEQLEAALDQEFEDRAKAVLLADCINETLDNERKAHDATIAKVAQLEDTNLRLDKRFNVEHKAREKAEDRLLQAKSQYEAQRSQFEDAYRQKTAKIKTYIEEAERRVQLATHQALLDARETNDLRRRLKSAEKKTQQNADRYERLQRQLAAMREHKHL